MDSNQLRVVGQYFVLQMHMYVKNERLYGSIVCDDVVVQFTNGSKVEKKKEIFEIYYKLAFAKTRPPHNQFWIFQIFFLNFKGWTFPLKALVDTMGWMMTEAMQNIVLKAMKSLLLITKATLLEILLFATN